MNETKKRVLLTVKRAPYERLQKNIKRAGLPNYFFARELDRVIEGLDLIVQQMIEAAEKGQMMTEEQIMESILRTSEKVQKMKIKKIEFEDPEE